MPYHRRVRVSVVALLFGAGLLLSTQSAFAAGYQINEHGAVGTGRAGAVVSMIDQPSAVFHNPAGLTRTTGTQFMGGSNLIVPQATYRGRGLPARLSDEEFTQSTTGDPTPVPYAYVSHALSKTAFVGIGYFNHYGLTVEWDNPDEFVGRTLVQEVSLRTFYITPTIALKLSDSVSVAVGVALVPATLSLTRVIGASDNQQIVFPGNGPGTEGTFEIEAGAFGVGATAGLQIDLTEHLRFGFAYRSAVDLQFEGDGDFEVPEGTPNSVAGNFPDQEVSGSLTLPHTFLAGIGWEADDWSIEFTGQVTLWTSYDSLTLDFSQDLPVDSLTLDRSWNVAPMFRLGGEYTFDIPLTLRAGIAYDVTPAPDRTVDPTLPDSDRFLATLGIGYDFGFIRVDFAYMGLYLFERQIDPEDNNVNFPTPTADEGYQYDDSYIHLASLSFAIKL